MRRSSKLILLCEDQQQQAFAYRFFKEMGWDSGQITLRPLVMGRGSAVQFVTEQFPKEILALRRRAVDAYLVVLIDGDAHGVAKRRAQLVQSCAAAGIAAPHAEDKVLVCVPTWNVETWLAYLDGETVDESSKNYAKLERPRECGRHVAALVQMCRERRLRQPYPASLDDTCSEYRRLFP